MNNSPLGELAKLLISMNIPVEDGDRRDMAQIFYPEKENARISVIYGKFSEGYDFGLLEMANFIDGSFPNKVYGCQTIGQVLNVIVSDWENFCKEYNSEEERGFENE